MAIFVAFAWMIEAAECLGLIESEAQDPASRAYRLAHQGLDVIKAELVGAPLEVLAENCVHKSSTTQEFLLESRDGTVFRRQADQCHPIVSLGPGGSVRFLTHGRGVEVRIQARTEDGGVYDVNLILPPVKVSQVKAASLAAAGTGDQACASPELPNTT